ncbi:EAL domain-containing protein [Arthrobacter sp. JCM 19049]|uniref:EAL domain-containing protein n=1 Tax=Arthrobacter sp. JCM 19049 TaxID=1460643 RepID=UPI0035B53ADF
MAGVRRYSHVRRQTGSEGKGPAVRGLHALRTASQGLAEHGAAHGPGQRANPSGLPNGDLGGGRAEVGVEALARWEHPELGELSPADFLPLAAESGLLSQLTTRLLDCAWPTWDSGGEGNGSPRTSASKLT